MPNTTSKARVLVYVATYIVLSSCSTARVDPKHAPKPNAETKKSYRHQGRYWYFFDNIQTAKQGGSPPSIRLWVALPLDRPGQKVEIGEIRPRPTEIIKDPVAGNRVVYWHLSRFAEGPLRLYFDFSVVNREVSFPLDPAQARRVSKNSPEHRRFTIKEPWLERTPELEKKAAEIVGGETNPLVQARRIYDWIIDHVTYDYPHVKDRGAKKAFARLKGDCGEFSHIFIAMMRSLGVPARSVTCVWYQGGGHAWAEIFVPPYGWIPVDTSGAQLVKNGLKGQMADEKVKAFIKTRGIPTRDPGYLFGNLYPNRLEVFVGENIELRSNKDGERRTFQFLQPGGKAAWPPSVETRGLSKKTVHGGFFIFGDDATSLAAARAKAERVLAPAYLSAGMYEEAKRGLLKAVKAKPKSATTLFQLGQTYFHLRRFETAIQTLRRSIDGKGGSTKKTTDTWAHLFIGMCHDALGRRSEAIEAYKAAMTIGADFGGALSTAKKLIKEPYVPEKKGD